MPLLEAGIGAAGGLFGSIISNIGARSRQKQANRENIEFWNMQNQYNHPSAQMQRLRDAGLNPNLIYGTGGASSTGQAEKIAPSKAPEFKMGNPLKDINAMATLEQIKATTDNLREQNTVLKQEAILKAATTGEIGVRTAKTSFDLGLAEELKNTSLQAAQANLKFTESKTIGVELDNSFKDKSLKNALKDVFYRVENAKENLKGTQLLNVLRQLEADLKILGIEKGDPWYFRILGRGYLRRQEAIKGYDSKM